MYDYLRNFVVTYMTNWQSFSEDEIAEGVQSSNEFNPAYSRTVRSEFMRSLSDRDFSWKDFMYEEVRLKFENSDEALKFAKKIIDEFV